MSKYHWACFIYLWLICIGLIFYADRLKDKLEAKETKIKELNNQIAIEIEKQEILSDELNDTIEWYMKNK